MAAVTPLFTYEEVPNASLKTIVIQVPSTAIQNDTAAVTLTDYGINATGLLMVDSWVHTTNGSVIVKEDNTTAVVAGVLTVTMTSANTAHRVIRVTGKAVPGVFV